MAQQIPLPTFEPWASFKNHIDDSFAKAARVILYGENEPDFPAHMDARQDFQFSRFMERKIEFEKAAAVFDPTFAMDHSRIKKYLESDQVGFTIAVYKLIRSAKISQLSGIEAGHIYDNFPDFFAKYGP